MSDTIPLLGNMTNNPETPSISVPNVALAIPPRNRVIDMYNLINKAAKYLNMCLAPITVIPRVGMYGLYAYSFHKFPHIRVDILNILAITEGSRLFSNLVVKNNIVRRLLKIDNLDKSLPHFDYVYNYILARNYCNFNGPSISYILGTTIYSLTKLSLFTSLIFNGIGFAVFYSIKRSLDKCITFCEDAVEYMHNPATHDNFNNFLEDINTGKRTINIVTPLLEVKSAYIYNDIISRDIENIAPVCSRLTPSNTKHFSEDTCCICHDTYDEERQLYRVLPKCKHSFHANCIDDWLANPQHSICPICRIDIV
jgi:hypothetical protein